MPYTYLSLVVAWLTAAVLVALSVSGAFTGRGIVLVAVLALIGPALILRRPAPPGSAGAPLV